MASRPPKEVTQLLLDWSNGNPAAFDALMPLVYDELRRIARRYMSHERFGHTLQTTALVHEAYLRLVDQKRVQWKDRAHFFAVAAQAMRRILIDHARKHRYAKRGGGAQKISLEEAAVISDERAADLVALDEALISLAAIDPQQSRVVEMRFFGGLTIEETAEVLKLSVDMVKREWATAKAWLFHQMSKS
jgi:RNA polymerase sigma-70 factor (ECF subfamily)